MGSQFGSHSTFQDRKRGLSGMEKPLLTRQNEPVELMQRYSKLADVSRIGRSNGARPVPVARPRVHNVRKRLGLEVVVQLVADYQAGVPTTALTRKYGIGNGTVLRILDDHGITRRHQSLTDEQVQQAIVLYQQGWPLARVGKQLGRDASLIMLTLKRAGVARRR